MKGIKHSALCVCSYNYVRSPMMHGVLSKMLTDIGITNNASSSLLFFSFHLFLFVISLLIPQSLMYVTGKREEWALAGAGVQECPNLEPIVGTKFILHREKCPVYAHSTLLSSFPPPRLLQLLFSSYIPHPSDLHQEQKDDSYCGNRVTNAPFEAYEYVIDVQKRRSYEVCT